MILAGSMTIQGFEYLLRSHGVLANRVIGYTEADTKPDNQRRCDQIQEWLDANMVSSWIVLDDEPPGMIASPDRERLVQTDGEIGLTDAHVELAIKLLNQV